VRKCCVKPLKRLAIWLVTATILAQAIFADGVRNVVAGASAIDIKRGLHRATKRAIDLRALSRPVATRKEKALRPAIFCIGVAAVEPPTSAHQRRRARRRAEAAPIRAPPTTASLAASAE
jgi:hypothetical protein